VIDRGGRLYQGRPFLNNATSLEDLPVFALGAHVGGGNTGNIGVSLLGCYHPPEGPSCQQEITTEALDTYVTLFAFLSERYGVSPSQIRGHRDFSSTACPGNNNYELLPQIRTDVTQLLVTGNAPIAQAAMSAEVDDDGVVRVSWEFTADFGVVGYRLERWSDGNRDAVLLEGTGAAPSTFADGSVVTSETVSYRMYVQSADGREQRVATIDVALDLPSRHTLAEVFPNPASGAVRLRYFLPTEGRVRLEVFDTMGRSVALAVDEVQDGDRWYSIPFDAGQLTGGVYFYRLVIEGFSGVVYDKTSTLVVTP
ncbi:MAG: T9SS type A sorting domain-containing protein, partial [Rhodothermales bacterium]|nr:T9SS type A sorting domain-containing protein [Rhodothermales bacterium]